MGPLKAEVCCLVLGVRDGRREHSIWQQKGGSKDVKGLWRYHEGLLVAHVPLELLRKIKAQEYRW